MVGLIIYNILEGVNLKDTAKKIGKKFSTGASSTKDGNIEMQGDMSEALKEWLPENIKEVYWFFKRNRLQESKLLSKKS